MSGVPPDTLLEFLEQPDEDIDLARAALLVARDAYPGLDIDSYMERIDEMAEPLCGRLDLASDPAAGLEALSRRFFAELGFSGNREAYYDPRNSYLNQVIERRTGIPITLAILYIAAGRRLGLPLEGVNFPLHFLVRCPAVPSALLVDPFDGGALVTPEDLRTRLEGGAEIPGEELDLEQGMRATPRQIMARLLRNLRMIYGRRGEYDRAADLGERIVRLVPEEAQDYRELGLLHYRQGAYPRSLEAFRAYLVLATDPAERNRARQEIHNLYARLGRLN